MILAKCVYFPVKQIFYYLFSIKLLSTTVLSHSHWLQSFDLLSAKVVHASLKAFFFSNKSSLPIMQYLSEQIEWVNPEKNINSKFQQYKAPNFLPLRSNAMQSRSPIKSLPLFCSPSGSPGIVMRKNLERTSCNPENVEKKKNTESKRWCADWRLHLWIFQQIRD